MRRSVRAGAAVVCFSGRQAARRAAGGRDGGDGARRSPRAAATRWRARCGSTSSASRRCTRRSRCTARPSGRCAEIPVLRMLLDDPRPRAERLAALIDGAEIVEATAKVGGGALPLLELPGPVVALRGHAESLAARLRAADPPVIGRVHDGRLLLDPRTLADDEVELVARAPAPLTVGTAGHIDHGKTALVRALTGVDTDRLPQERERGISIELGYASLALPSGRRLSLIDVPGHERFVRTMVAGATGIDLFLMVVAADDGVMPQTREHAAVLRALDVRRGCGGGDEDRPRCPPLDASRRSSRRRPDRAVLGAHRRGRRRGGGGARGGRRLAAGPLRPQRGDAGAPRRPGVHDPRRGDGRHRDALVGRGRPRRPAAAAPGRPRGPGARRAGPRRGGRARGGGAARRAQPRRRRRARRLARRRHRDRAARADVRRRRGARGARRGARPARPGPPRDARGAGAARRARRPLLAAAPRAAAPRPRRRPRRHPLDRAAGHARRRRRPRPAARRHGPSREALARLTRLARDPRRGQSPQHAGPGR